MKSSDVKNEFDVNFDDAGEFAFHLRREEVCVNPYHYTKVSQLWEGVGGKKWGRRSQWWCWWCDHPQSSSKQMDQSYKWRQWSSRWMTMVTTMTMVTMIKRRWISRFCRQCWSPRTSPERWQLCHHCWLWQNLMTNFNDKYMTLLIIIQGVFLNWYPPKKLKYVKPRLGESTLT